MLFYVEFALRGCPGMHDQNIIVFLPFQDGDSRTASKKPILDGRKAKKASTS
jgi:hypothetical protein